MRLPNIGIYIHGPKIGWENALTELDIYGPKIMKLLAFK